jgi:D-amino peptidase
MGCFGRIAPKTTHENTFDIPHIYQEIRIMKILIAADMEGITGVVHWDQVTSTHPEYERFRKIMTGDVNAAIRGACSAGAEEVIVSDGHGSGRNILIEELDGRATLCSGTPSTFSMVEGIDTGVDGVLLIGYHAKVGTPFAILEHTWSDERVANLWLRGGDEDEYQTYGEIGLNAAVCGHFGVPVLMISGDQAACSEARALLGEIGTAVVKWPSSRMAARCLPPVESQRKIQDTAYHVVSRLRSSIAGNNPYRPFVLQPPIGLAIDFTHSEMADKASLLPETIRADRRIAYTGVDMVAIYQAFRAAVTLAK